MNLWFYIIAGATIWTIGDIFMKYWMENHKFSFFLIGLLIWTVGLICLAYSFKFKHMAVASTMMITLNSVILILVLWIFFKEQLTLTQMVGIALGIVTLYILEIG
jgi:spermidine export protein MdtJ